MKALIRIPTLLLGVIALVTGAASVWGGLAHAPALLDNTHRFYAGIWLALGLGLVHSAVFFDRSERVFGFVMRALVVGGIARAVGLLDVPPEPGIAIAIAIEVVVPVVLLALRTRLLRTRKAPALTNGKSVLVTGANGGLGQQTVAALAEDGFSRIVMGVRDRARGRAARDSIEAEVELGPDTALEVVEGFDMTDPTKIEAAIDALPADRPFDAVFLQAGGVIFSDEVPTVTHGGRTFERTIFQNAIGAHFVLSRLARRGLLAPGARVVYAGGEGARGIPGLIEKPRIETPEQLRRALAGDLGGAPFHTMNAIGVSKFVGALWTNRVARLFGDRLSIVWLSPGLTYGTQGLAKAPTLRRFMAERVGFPIMALLGLAQSPKDGARKYADCIVGTIGRNGDVIGAPRGKALGELVDQTPMNPAMGDQALQRELWSILEDLDETTAQWRRGEAPREHVDAA